MRLFFRLLATSALAALFSGCAGYHLGPAKPPYLKDVHTLAVPAFRNNTLLPRVEGLISDILIRQVQQDGTYQIASLDDADAILTGYIEKIQRTPARSVSGNILLTREFQLEVGIRFQLADRKTGMILDSGRANGSTSFFVGNDVQQDERQAIPLAAEQAAIRVVSQIAEGF